MTEKLKQKVKEELIKIPKKNRDAINSLDWDKISEEIAKSYLSTDSETNDLQVEIFLVLFGLEPAESFNLNVERNLIISKNTADKINNEVINKIFKPISNLINESETTDKKNIVPKPNNNYHNLKLGPRFKSLPNRLKIAISESNYQSEIYSLGKKYGLSIEGMGVLEKIIEDIIVGTTKTTKFESELKSKIEIPIKKIPNLIEDANHNIFDKIREIMKVEENNNDIPTPPYVSQNIKKNIIETVPKPPQNDKIEKIDEKNSKKEVSDILKNSAIDIVEEKLMKPTKNKDIISDYSIPKMSTEDTRKNDPYREKI